MQIHQYNYLVFEFCQDLKAILLEEAFALTARYERPAPRRKAQPRKPTPVVLPALKVVEPKEYLPHVSDEILQAVYEQTDQTAVKDSQTIAKEIKRGETAVRVALKHLVKRGVCKTHRDGKRVYYSRLHSWSLSLKDFP